MIKTDEHLYTMTRVEFARSIGKSREGGSVFRCGANEGLSDPYQCKIISICKLGEQTEISLRKPN